MKVNALIHVLLIGFLGITQVNAQTNNQLITYPQPKLESDPSIAVPPSPLYSVELKQGDGEWVNSFTYYSQGHSMHTETTPNPDESNSWTSFSFDGSPVSVKVKLLQGDVSYDVVVRPKSKKISPFASPVNNMVIFEISEPGQFSVEINGEYQHAMFVFANPLEEIIPTEASEKLHYFGPGVHDIGLFYGDNFISTQPQNTNPYRRPINEGDTIYIAGGAYLFGTISASHNIYANTFYYINNVTILGRGIVSGELYKRNDPNYAIFNTGESFKYALMRGGDNCSIEGISIVNSPGYSNTFGNNTHINNIKCLSWYGSTDAYAVGNSSITENSFSKVMDDHTKVRGNEQIVRNNTYFLQRNGSAVIFSYNATNDVNSFSMTNCDVLHADNTYSNAVFEAKHGGGATISGLYFEDIRVEGDCNSFFGLALRNNQWVNDQSLLYGRITDITFKNVSVEGVIKDVNWLWGRTSGDYLDNILFEDVSINGKVVSTMEESSFSIGPFVKNITFKVDGQVTSQTNSLSNQANTAMTIIPAADCPVWQKDPNTNMGVWRSVPTWSYWEQIFLDKTTSNEDREGFMRFESLPPAFLYDQAYLVLFGVKNTAPNSYQILCEKIDEDDWKEDELTWNTSRNLTVSDKNVEHVFTAGSNIIDITNLTKEETDGKLSLKISSKQNTRSPRFYTKEANTPFRHIIHLVFKWTAMKNMSLA